MRRRKQKRRAPSPISTTPSPPLTSTDTCAMTELSSAAKSQLTPKGTLRVALNLSNFLLISSFPKGGTPTGIVPDLAHELGRRLGVAVEFTGYESPGKVADAAPTGAWDVAFLGAEPARANVIDFTAAYLEIEATYLVPPGSAIKNLAD